MAWNGWWDKMIGISLPGVDDVRRMTVDLWLPGGWVGWASSALVEALAAWLDIPEQEDVVWTSPREQEFENASEDLWKGIMWWMTFLKRRTSGWIRVFRSEERFNWQVLKTFLYANETELKNRLFTTFSKVIKNVIKIKWWWQKGWQELLSEIEDIVENIAWIDNFTISSPDRYWNPQIYITFSPDCIDFKAALTQLDLILAKKYLMYEEPKKGKK